MLQIPVSEVISRIKKETNLSEKEINSKIKEKINSLEGLVSEEGAAYIVANELGVSLLDSIKKSQIKVENVSGGMQSVDIVGKVTRVFQPRHWEKGRKKGTVASFIMADKTGTIRIVIWDERVELIGQGKIKEGDIIRVKNGYAKKNLRGEREIHLNMNSQIIINPENVKVEVADIKEREVPESKEVEIKDIEVGDSIKTRGVVVQLFDPYFYQMCPECRKRVDDEGECEEHGKVEPGTSVVFNFVLDDGTATVRCVSFGKTAQILMGLNEELDKLSEENPEELKEKINNFLLGKEIIVEGIVRENQAYERLEVIINRSRVNIDAKELANLLSQK
ncbi:MAG: DUF2240 family protein [Candidatus Woesearchaeota archaeon]|nr:MAG: DUF2240 family protein [Candidatus Woesearchaeota archaeon]